jgi:hypothetical protein
MPNVMEIWEPKPPGTLWATPGLLQDPFTFTFNDDAAGTAQFHVCALACHVGNTPMFLEQSWFRNRTLTL